MGRNFKIPEREWREISRRNLAGETLAEIAQDYNVVPATIGHVLDRVLETKEAKEAKKPNGELPAPPSVIGEVQPKQLVPRAIELIAAVASATRPDAPPKARERLRQAIDELIVGLSTVRSEMHHQ